MKNMEIEEKLKEILYDTNNYQPIHVGMSVFFPELAIPRIMELIKTIEKTAYPDTEANGYVFCGKCGTCI